MLWHEKASQQGTRLRSSKVAPCLVSISEPAAPKPEAFKNSSARLCLAETGGQTTPIILCYLYYIRLRNLPFGLC